MQDVARCKFCGPGVVKLHCTFCLSAQCEQCSTRHILSDTSNRHEVIAFSNKNVDPRPTRPYNYPKSRSRGGEEHNVDSVALQEKLYSLSKDAEQIRSQKILQMLRLMKELERQISEVHKIYDDRFNNIVSQVQSLHDAINQLEKDYKTKLDEMGKRDVRKLKEQQTKIESLITEANEKLKEFERSNTQQKQKFEFPLLSLPQPVQCTAPTFVPKKLDKEFVRSLFGTLTESNVQAPSEKVYP
uniref:Uncharacterized protein LOC111109202 n=1 Tax=Crassostrea virginica TaxID=6565 RepID=A0A8B8BCR9_CRAVI|nr:uncharacterized protein LOC111109202 [Crassostrea virginica]